MSVRLEPGDASVLVAAIETYHPDPFLGAVGRDVLLREAARVDSLAVTDNDVLVVELMRTMARLGVGNGHSAIYPLDDHPVPHPAFPLHLYEFEDGVFVVAAERTDLAGAEMIGVEGIDVEDVLRAVDPLIARDNGWTIRARRPTFVLDASVLRGLGILNHQRRATFRMRRRDGTVENVPLEAIPADAYRARFGSGDSLPERPGPAYLRRRNDRQWAELTADGRAIHVGYNVTRGDVTGLVRDVETLAAAPGTILVILDLRHNGGGDNRTYRPLLESLERLATDRRLAVLTSRRTFSAAMQLVVDLERTGAAVFVGEPTGGSPNHYGDATVIELPGSGLRAHVATIAWATAGDADERTSREPDIHVALDASTFFADEDPTLTAAVAALS